MNVPDKNINDLFPKEQEIRSWMRRHGFQSLCHASKVCPNADWQLMIATAQGQDHAMLLLGCVEVLENEVARAHLQTDSLKKFDRIIASLRKMVRRRRPLSKLGRQNIREYIENAQKDDEKRLFSVAAQLVDIATEPGFWDGTDSDRHRSVKLIEVLRQLPAWSKNAQFNPCGCGYKERVSSFEHAVVHKRLSDSFQRAILRATRRFFPAYSSQLSLSARYCLGALALLGWSALVGFLSFLVYVG